MEIAQFAEYGIAFVCVGVMGYQLLVVHPREKTLSRQHDLTMMDRLDANTASVHADRERDRESLERLTTSLLTELSVARGMAK